MEPITIVVRAVWDPEAEVWVASSPDVPGLATEAATHAELYDKLQIMIPELLEGDHGRSAQTISEIPLVIMSEQVGKIRLRAA
jgi:predicted RNase H-like HicB family nuclease